MKLLVIAVFASLTLSAAAQTRHPLFGAWEEKDGSQTRTITYAGGFFSVAVFDVSNKQFISTYGGKVVLKENELVETIEYDTQTPANVGTERRVTFKLLRNELTMSGATQGKFKRLDNGTPGELAGAWLITGRMRDGEIQRSTPGVRRTMKILSGTRFQWIAYNTETKEFFGTGGGYYTTEDGKYTEEIEFFSRDSTRVGAKLTFDFSIQDGDWRHQGKSSKGEPLDEIWTLREKLN